MRIRVGQLILVTERYVDSTKWHNCLLLVIHVEDDSVAYCAFDPSGLIERYHTDASREELEALVADGRLAVLEDVP